MTEKKEIPWTDILIDTRNYTVYKDGFPVTEGHVLFVPKNDDWKYVVGTRGIQEELGIYENVEWKCVNECQYKWGK